MPLPPPQIADAIDWLCDTMIGYAEAYMECQKKKKISTKNWKELQDFCDLKKEAKQELWRKIQKYGKR